MSTDVHSTPHPDLETLTPSPGPAGAAPSTAIEEEVTQPSEPSLLDYRHRITVDEYQRIADAGIFPDRAPIELLEGVLIQKMTIKPPHIISCELLEDLLHRLVPPGWYCSMGNPMQIREDDSEPEPDAQVIRGGPRDYTDHKHGPQDAALVVEVADTSLPYDRSLKLRAYARASVPVYWIVNLNARVLEVFTEPSGSGAEAHYSQHRIYEPDEEVTLILDGREVARLTVRDILP